MRRNLILKHFYQIGKPAHSQEFESRFLISNRTFRNEVRELNSIGEDNGFVIQKKRDGRYMLVVENLFELQRYFSEIENNSASGIPFTRVNSIIVMLLLTKEFQTIDTLAEFLSVSRSTLQADLLEVEKRLKVFDLQLEGKSHFGIRLIGDEKNFRKALTLLITQNENVLLKRERYQEFEMTFPYDLMKEVLKEELQNHRLNLSFFALENILIHIQVLAFRVTQKNFILKKQEERIDISLLKPIFLEISRKICDTLSDLYEVELPESEISYLAVQISGKTSTDDIEESEKDDLRNKLLSCLERLDATFLTTFSNDEQLLDTLLLHIYPLLQRLYFNLTLPNPLIDDVYSRYSYVFVIALNFSGMIKELWDFELSKDEIGYIVLHFATHFERNKQKQLSSYKRILLLQDSCAGSVNLLKVKLELIIQNAEIDVRPFTNLQSVDQSKYDLLVSSTSIESKKVKIPYIKVSPILSEYDMEKIKKNLAVDQSVKKDIETKNLVNLFHPKLFYIESSSDYEKLIFEKAEHLVELGFADSIFPNLVMEREKRISTVLQNGIAAPHSLKMVAIRETLSVVILRKPFKHKGKLVQIVFLINLTQGDLNIYREVNRLVIKLIENSEAKQKILKSRNFSDFQYEITKLLKI